ncbi:MAG: HalOD1 output domain-containing protein [Haloferacaceae archaeon]
MAVEPFEAEAERDASDEPSVGRVEVGGAADRPSVAVVEAVARATGERPEPGTLYRAVDPDALDALFADRPDGSARTGGTLSFVVGDCVVAVRADGEVTAAAL